MFVKSLLCAFCQAYDDVYSEYWPVMPGGSCVAMDLVVVEEGTGC
jgi:hypothetical protein